MLMRACKEALKEHAESNERLNEARKDRDEGKQKRCKQRSIERVEREYKKIQRYGDIKRIGRRASDLRKSYE